jgi:hypothetical protein
MSQRLEIGCYRSESDADDGAGAAAAYMDLGRKTNVATDASLLSDHFTQSQVKIGVNYRFGGPAAVVAKC